MPRKKKQRKLPDADSYQYYIPSTASTSKMVKKKKPGTILWPDSYHGGLVRATRRRKPKVKPSKRRYIPQ